MMETQNGQSNGQSNGEKKMVKIWVDGFFDMAHFGHANFFRQARQFGDYLIVGVHNDEVAVSNKGLPAFTYEERLRMVKAIRWVDEVVGNAPYFTSLETMDNNNCDFTVHGDDVSMTPDGHDTYELVRNSGRFREVPRTSGVSTTNLIGRLLLDTRAYEDPAEFVPKSPFTGGSSYLSSGLVAEFYSNRRKPGPSDKIVYVAGAFDMFHVGHLAFLEAAVAEGTYLIVGIHKNKTVSSYKGPHRPFMSLHERVLSVLSFRCVDDVIIGAPYEVTSELLDQFKVNVVCHGMSRPLAEDPARSPFAEPIKRGIFKIVDSGSDMVTDKLLDRIIANREKYRDRNVKKELKEINFLNQKKSIKQT